VNGEAPLSTKGSTDEVDIGTVSGLTAGSSAKVDLSFMDWPHASEKSTKDLTSVCTAEIPNLISGATAGTAYDWQQILTWSDSKETCSRAIFNIDTLRSMVDALNSRLKKCDPPPPPLPANAPPAEQARAKAEQAVCDALKSRGGAKLTEKARDPSNLRRILTQVGNIERTAAPAVTLYTLGTTVNRQKVSYFAQNNLSTLVKDNTTGYGAHASYARILGNLMYSFGFSYEKSYKNADAVQVCSPVSGSTSLVCSQGTIGAPKHMFSRILFGELRQLISPGAFALEPRLEYDFTSSKLAARLPIYFAPSKDKVLTGGITLGYVRHGDGFGASMFVNKAFSFY